jgi:amino acid permease
MLSTVIIVVAYAVCYFSINFITKSITVLTAHTFIVFGLFLGFCCRNLDVHRLDNPTRAYKSINWPLFINLLVFNSSGYDCVGSVIVFVKNPDKVIPRAMFAAAVVVVMMYEIVYLLTYMGTTIPADEWTTAQFAIIAGDVAGRWLQIWVILASCLINLQLFISSLTAAIFTMHGAAELGVFPKWFKHTTSLGTPDRALLVCGILSILFGVVPFSVNLAFESIMYCILTLAQIACFFSIKSADYHFITKSNITTASVVIPPAIITVFVLSIQNRTVYFMTLLLSLVVAFVGAITMRCNKPHRSRRVSHADITPVFQGFPTPLVL